MLSDSFRGEGTSQSLQTWTHSVQVLHCVYVTDSWQPVVCYFTYLGEKLRAINETVADRSMDSIYQQQWKDWPGSGHSV